MNKQQFDMDIQAADNNSLRIGAANRIVQLLQKLRYSNNENSAKNMDMGVMPECQRCL